MGAGLRHGAGRHPRRYEKVFRDYRIHSASVKLSGPSTARTTDDLPSHPGRKTEGHGSLNPWPPELLPPRAWPPARGIQRVSYFADAPDRSGSARRIRPSDSMREVRDAIAQAVYAAAARTVKPWRSACCCYMKMSGGNRYVKRSSCHGDLHVEPKGTAPPRVVESGLCRPHYESASC